MSPTRRDFIRTATLGGFGLAVAPGGPFGFDVAPGATSPPAGATGKRRPWSTVAFGKIAVGGELAHRAQQNWRRLQHPAYRVPKVFASPTARGWPGDWVSRTLLGTVLLARSTAQDAPETHRIFRDLPAHLNAAGYFGDLIDPHALNEQQVGLPLGWLLRALVEYDAWTGEPRARELLDTLVRQLALPMRDWWASYPVTREVRQRGHGGVVGTAHWRAGRWVLSSDIGSQFLVLDGLTQAWQLDRSAELKATIDAGIERFLTMDLLGVQAQAHSSLSTLRALLRMYALTGDAALVRAVEERYGLYRRVAMTETYANYNWFGRPETWTEPCAIIDSFIVAMQLWQFTGQPQYLEDAHLIWFNGVGRGQRATGGFGCDTCAGVKDPFLQMALMYEATFCCTMRGGEGHSYAIQSAYHTRPGELAVTFYTDSTADLDLGRGRVVLEQSTQYPYDGAVRFQVRSSTLAAPITLRFFTPSWLANPRLLVNGQRLASRMEDGFLVAEFVPRTGDAVALESTLRTWVRPTRNPHSLAGYQAIHAGPLLLGSAGEQEVFLPGTAELLAHGPGRFQVRGRDVVLRRINDLNELAPPNLDPIEVRPVDLEKGAYVNEYANTRLLADTNSRRQVLFREA